LPEGAEKFPLRDPIAVAPKTTIAGKRHSRSRPKAESFFTVAAGESNHKRSSYLWAKPERLSQCQSVFITAGYVQGARIMKDAINLLADEIAALNKAIGGAKPRSDK